MFNLYYLSVTLHVLAAMVWLGGMFFLGLVGAPELRKIEPPAVRAALFGRLGRRFRRVGWSAIGVLVLTGSINLHFRGLLRVEIFADPVFWRSRLGQALAWKLSAVIVMLAISAHHDFIAGPAAGRLPVGSAAAEGARRRASIWARVNAVVGIVLVVAAVRLARGG